MEQLTGTPTLRVEKRAIDYIPPEERHGRPNTLLTFWGASTITLVAIEVGAIPIFIGLDLKWAILSIFIGNIVGGLFMAYHSVQGPRLGMPQMIQSRAQFGFYGAALPLVIVVVMYIGYYVLGIVVGGQALAALIHVSDHVGMILSAAVMVLMTWVGYDLFHAFNRLVAILSALLFVGFTVKLLSMLPSAHLAAGTFTAGNFILGISIFASWQITYAPYVSDYSRYLPEHTPASLTFWYTYLGSVVGSCWAMCLGAIGAAVAIDAFGANTAGFMAGLFPGIKWLTLLVLVLGVYAANYENPYGAFLTSVSTLSPTGRFAPTGKLARGPGLRVVVTTIITVISTVIAYLATAHFITNLTNFLVYALAALAPWTAINLTDFYLVRRGHYDIGEFFKVDGAYGKLNGPAVAIFIITVLVEIPFLDTAYYVGPIAKRLGGGDISWLVGLVVAASLYYVVATRMLRLQDRGTVTGPDVS